MTALLIDDLVPLVRQAVEVCGAASGASRGKEVGGGAKESEAKGHMEAVVVSERERGRVREREKDRERIWERIFIIIVSEHGLLIWFYCLQIRR